MTKNEIRYLDFIEFQDGSIEILYTLGHDSDEVYMKDAGPSDQNFIDRMRRYNAAPQEEFVQVW